MYVQDILRKTDKVFESREFFCGSHWFASPR
jgi:hypothetical protein